MPIRKGDNVDHQNRSSPHAPPAPAASTVPRGDDRTPACPPRTVAPSSQPAIEVVLDAGAVTMAFQPIVDLETASIIGYEALLRPAANVPFSSPVELFAAATRAGQATKLDAMARSLALDAAASWPEPLRLFLNITPDVLCDPDFPDRIAREADARGIDPHRVMLELTEWAAVERFEGLELRTLELRERGFRVAIDDVGAGINGLNQIMAIRPDWIKLDRTLVVDLDHDQLRQNLIRFLVHFARMSNVGLIAEGVERSEVLEVLVQLGVTHAQGFYLGRPGTANQVLCPKVRSCIHSARDCVAARRLEGTRGVRLRSLTRPAVLCRRPLTAHEAAERLAGEPGACGIVLFDQSGEVIGWLPRARVTELADDNRVKPLDTLACRGFLTMDGDLSIGESLHAMASRLDGQAFSVVVVKERGQPSGVIELRDLIGAAADIHTENAAHLSPLTGLPDRVHADRWLDQGIRIGDPCDVALLDLRGFDVYNRSHGHEMGDQMLRRLAELLQRLVIDRCTGAVFCAHLGADRFLIASSLNLHDTLEELANEFDRRLGEFFSPMEIACQSFHANTNADSTSASDSAAPIPLTSLRIIYLTQALLGCASPREVYRLADRLRDEDTWHFANAAGMARPLFIEATTSSGRTAA